MKNRFLALVLIIISISFGACKKCYDCVKKCGTCTHLILPTLAGCEGDDVMEGRSIETWKVYLESQGYSCAYNNQEVETCKKSEREQLEDSNYNCVEQ